MKNIRLTKANLSYFLNWHCLSQQRFRCTLQKFKLLASIRQNFLSHFSIRNSKKFHPILLAQLHKVRKLFCALRDTSNSAEQFCSSSSHIDLLIILAETHANIGIARGHLIPICKPNKNFTFQMWGYGTYVVCGVGKKNRSPMMCIRENVYIMDST